jgi:inhibitor of cysteine peptidase
VIRCLSFALAAVALVAAGGWAESGLRLTAKDNGRTVAMQKGTQFSLALRQNITTGYSWQVVSHGEPAVEQVGEGAFAPDTSLHGAGGTVTFHFRAVAVGRGELSLVYTRPWEKDAKPADTFAVTIVVER